jgi:hypothetical protein
MPRHSQDAHLVLIVKLADQQAEKFRPERLLIIVFVGLALMVMLGVAIYALIQKEWETAKAMLLGSGAIASCTTTGFGYMYNRKLRFIEAMSARQPAGE